MLSSPRNTIALHCNMQGLKTTPAHGHTALFGAYGMFGVGSILFVRSQRSAESVATAALFKQHSRS